MRGEPDWIDSGLLLCQNGRTETWRSGLTYLFAKEADLLKGLEGSNPSVSAL